MQPHRSEGPLVPLELGDGDLFLGAGEGDLDDGLGDLVELEDGEGDLDDPLVASPALLGKSASFGAPAHLQYPHVQVHHFPSLTQS